MKIALIGCGGISECHLEAIKRLEESGAKLACVADIIKQRAEKATEKYGGRAYTNYLEMLDFEKPDVVHICTPHYLHAQMAIQALNRQINVVLEKPCAISNEELALLKEAQKNSSAKIGVCFQNRYNPSVKFAKNLLDSKKYGEAKSARAIVTWRRDADYYASGAWRGTWSEEGGGVLINQAIHSHDLMMYLYGKKTKTVDGKISNFHLKNEIEVEDTASVYFTFEDSSRAVYFATNAAGSSTDPIIEIQCENAALRIEGSNVFEITNEIKCIFSNNDEQELVGKKEWGDSHTLLIKDFYECVEKNEPFWLDVFQASRAVEELLAAYESSKTGKQIKL